MEKSLLPKLKLLLGIPASNTERDGLLQFVLDAVTEEAQSYCNLEELPPRLETIILRMAVDVWRKAGLGQETAPASVSSVTRGDVSVSYRQESAGGTDVLSAAGSAAGEYRAQLNAFRKLRW